MLLDAVIAGEAGSSTAIPKGVRIVRCLRRYVSKVFRGKFRGGMFLDWGGQLTGRLKEMTARLRDYYGEPRRLRELLDAHGWEEVEVRGR